MRTYFPTPAGQDQGTRDKPIVALALQAVATGRCTVAEHWEGPGGCWNGCLGEYIFSHPTGQDQGTRDKPIVALALQAVATGRCTVAEHWEGVERVSR